MTKPIILFIQGGGEGAHAEDKKLVLFLAAALGQGYQVIYPRMEHEEDPDYKTYRYQICGEMEKSKSAGPLLLVGHSVGSCFLLKFLSEEQTPKPVLGLFLLSTPYWGEGGWQYEGFSIRDDFAALLPPDLPIYFYHGTGDKTVAPAHLVLYEKKLPRAKFRLLKDRDHQLNNELPELVKDIRQVINNLPV